MIVRDQSLTNRLSVHYIYSAYLKFHGRCIRHRKIQETKHPHEAIGEWGPNPMLGRPSTVHCKKKYAVYTVGEYSGISSLKLKNSGI
jgi:hypothetical protein